MPVSHQSSTKGEINRIKLLLADPDAKHRSLLAQKLRSHEGFEVDEVGEEDPFFKMVAENHFDLVLLDPQLADKNVSRFIREVRQIRGDQEYIVISEKPDYEILMIALKEGALDFFQKPVDEMAIARIAQHHRYRIFRSRYASRVDRYISQKFVELVLPTDISILSYVSSRVSEDIYHANAIQPGQIYNLNLALFEGLTNALEHGNLGISYSRKTEFIMSGQYMDRIESLSQQEPYRDRVIRLRYNISSEKVEISIEDQGEGFDASKFLQDGRDRLQEDYHGRGIILILKTMDHVYYNDTGNRITFVLYRRKN